MNTQMPQAVNNYNLYIGDKGERFIGLGNLEIPELSAITTEINMAGMAGKVNVPLIGQFDALNATISAQVQTIQAIKMAIPESQIITARVAVQTQNTATGRTEIQSQTYLMKGQMSSYKTGQLEKGANQDTAVSFEIDYLKISIDSKSYFELDKFNNIFIVNGVDYLAAVNNAI